MKNDMYLTLERKDLAINEEIEVGDEPGYVYAYLEAWFDVDKKFGLNTANRDDAWVNLYARYNSLENILLVDYIVSTDNSSFAREYQPTETERKLMIRIMEEACIKQTEMNCYDFSVKMYLEDFEDDEEMPLVCEKVSDTEYQIRSTFDDFVIYKENETGRLKDHAGHKMEFAIHHTERGDGYLIKCADCNEILLVQNEDPMEELDYGTTEYLYDKYRIIVSPDYHKAAEIGDEISEVYCRVYHKDDILCKDSLGDFNMMCDFEYLESTAENIENAMRSAIDESAGYYDMALECKTLKRSDELFGRAVSYIIELTGTDGLRETLIEKLDMSEEEADKMVQDLSISDTPQQDINLG